VPKLDGLRVLLVEDNPDSLSLMTVALETCGATVFPATSAGEAMQIVVTAAPALIVSDLSLPGEDGISLLQRIRSSGATAPAIAVTGHVGERTRALAAGFSAFLTKPLNPDVLCTAVGAFAAGLRAR